MTRLTDITCIVLLLVHSPAATQAAPRIPAGKDIDQQHATQPPVTTAKSDFIGHGTKDDIVQNSTGAAHQGAILVESTVSPHDSAVEVASRNQNISESAGLDSSDSSDSEVSDDASSDDDDEEEKPVSKEPNLRADRMAADKPTDTKVKNITGAVEEMFESGAETFELKSFADWTIADAEPVERMWADFKNKFNRNFQDKSGEEPRRRLFESRVSFIKQHNNKAARGQATYTLAVNEFTDWSDEELKQKLLGVQIPADYLPPISKIPGMSRRSKRQLPSSVDWRQKGYVTPVKAQGSCGSCYAFAALGALEGQWFKKTGQLLWLSEQNVVDCSGGYGNSGCNGGWMTNVYNYLSRNGGVNLNSSYPYQGKLQTCRYQKGSPLSLSSLSYQSFSPDEYSLMNAVATVGPISVAVDAGRPGFVSYSGGVYNDASCSRKVNHGMLVVGYGNYNGQDYWLVKNSWGRNWGIGGYIMMSRFKANQCGIASYPTYPVV